MITRVFTVVRAAIISIVLVQQLHAQAPTLILDDFETGSVRIINATDPDPNVKFLWNQYDNPTNVVSVTNTVKRSGSYSLLDHVTNRNMYLSMNTYCNSAGDWRWMHDFVGSGNCTAPFSSWTPNTYNRMRVWIKVPTNLPTSSPQFKNLELGTFERASTSGGHEDNNNHWYHFFNVPPTTEWYQIILDSHPSHQRGGAGGTEWGDKLHVTGEAGWNYFDAMTNFYLDFTASDDLPSYPQDFYVDRIELFQEINPVNIAQVYSLGGVYVPASNRLHVGWQHPKNDGTTCHEVRYAFQDVFALGFNNATPAPLGMRCPISDVYSSIEYDTTAINVTGQSTIYIAIKPTNSSSFNQISIPISIAPIIVSSPANGAVVSGSSVAVNATNNVAFVGVQFKLDGNNLLTEDTTAPFSIVWNSTTASNGSHTLTAVGRDSMGVLTTSDVVTVTVDNLGPTVTITAPAGGATVSGAITVSANASDTAGVAGVQFKLDGNDLGAEDTSAPYSITWTTNSASNGSHTLTAVARDTPGNTTTSANVVVTVSNIPDTTNPTVSITAPSNLASVSLITTVSANAADNVAVASVQFFYDGMLIGTDSSSPYSVSWDTTLVANGSYNLTAVATDTSNNTATSAIVAVTVANLPVAHLSSGSVVGNGNLSKAFTSANAAGSLIVVAVTWGNTTVITASNFSDTRGNTYQVARQVIDNTNTQSAAVAYALNVSAGANTVTFTAPGGASFTGLLIHEYSGIAAFDVSAGQVSPGTTAANGVTSTAATTTAAGDLIFGVSVDIASGGAAITAGTGFTQRQNITGNTLTLESEDRLQAAPGSIAATWTYNLVTRYISIVAAFKPALIVGFGKRTRQITSQ